MSGMVVGEWFVMVVGFKWCGKWVYWFDRFIVVEFYVYEIGFVFVVIVVRNGVVVIGDVLVICIGDIDDVVVGGGDGGVVLVEYDEIFFG